MFLATSFSSYCLSTALPVPTSEILYGMYLFLHICFPGLEQEWKDVSYSNVQFLCNCASRVSLDNHLLKAVAINRGLI